jgi:hypothetical protein
MGVRDFPSLIIQHAYFDQNRRDERLTSYHELLDQARQVYRQVLHEAER